MRAWMEPPNTFGAWLRQRREALGLTRKEFAHRVGCSASTVRKIEDGERRPSRQVAELLADRLGLPAEQHHTFFLVARGERGVDRLPPLPALPLPHLPSPPAPLVGREPELAQIERLLMEADCRLLTLTGEGGIGKTRLALEAARRRAAHPGEPFSDGVGFVPLAPVSGAEHLLPALADAIGFTFYGPTDPGLQLLNYLYSKRMLLVLDGLEHLREAAGLIADILSRAPGVKLLVTSRERLRLQGEWVFELKGLSFPVLAHPGEGTESTASEAVTAALEAYGAVALFLQCARRAGLGFRLTPRNREAVLRICQLVEGLPLGIELAASWIRALPVEEIALEIERDLNFLATSAPDVPDRHRSIRAAFDHSWKLLSDDERRVLARLSVFRGGFRRAAAEQAAGATLPMLSGLVEKSLVRHAAARYDLHELVRQYAAMRLQADPQAEAEARWRHAEYYFALLHAREPDLRDERQKSALAELSAEIDNVHAAWDWALAQGRVSALRPATTALMVYHELRNRFHDGDALFGRALAVARTQTRDRPDDPTLQIALADLQAQRAYFGFRLGRMAESQAMLRDSLAILREHGEWAVYADVLWYHAFACWFGGDFAAASEAALESRELNTKLGRSWQVAIVSVILGGVAHEQGAYANAQRQLDEALGRCRATGDPRLISFALSLLSRTHQALGQFAETRDLLREGYGQAADTGDRYGMGLALEQLALASHAVGDSSEARRLFGEGLALYREIGDPWSLSRALNHRGRFHLGVGEAADARRDFREALATAMGGGAMANALDALAGLAAAQAQAGPEGMAAALELALLVGNHPASADETRERAGQLRDELEARLTPQQREAVRTRVRALDRVIGELLGSPDSGRPTAA